MKAYKGKQEIKDALIAQVYEHTEKGEIKQGNYYRALGGTEVCLIGCVAHSNDVGKIEREYGIPVALSKIAEQIFENLDKERMRTFPLEFYSCIVQGMDLHRVVLSFLYYCVASTRDNADAQGKKAIDTVLALFDRMLAGEDVSEEDWRTAHAAAAYAAFGTTYATAYAAFAATYATRAAANAAAYAANAAATNHATVAAYAAYATHEEMAEVLLQLIREEGEGVE